MKTKIRGGGTFPSSVSYGSVKLEIEREVPTHESVHKVVNDLKLEVAKLAAGSDSTELEKCLRVVNYPDRWDKIQELRALCDAYRYEISILKESLKKDYPNMLLLKALMTREEVINDLSVKHSVSDEFWDDLKAMIVREEQELEDDLMSL